MDALHGEAGLSPEAAVSAPPSKTALPSARAAPRCPECLSSFVRKQPAQLFCKVEHKRAYNNRWLKRGAVLAPLYLAARLTRGGSRGDKLTGARARRDAEHAGQRWIEEDRAAGRMPAVEYIAERYRLGLVDVA